MLYSGGALGQTFIFYQLIITHFHIVPLLVTNCSEIIWELTHPAVTLVVACLYRTLILNKFSVSQSIFRLFRLNSHSERLHKYIIHVLEQLLRFQVVEEVVSTHKYVYITFN